MKIATAAPSVQAVFEVLGPAFARGRIARVTDAGMWFATDPGLGARA